jgi:hypothetical protein
MANKPFQLVDDDPQTPETTEVSLLKLALQSLGQRAHTVVSDLIMLVTVGLVWWVFQSTPDPTSAQLIKLPIFSAFVLGANLIVRKVK